MSLSARRLGTLLVIVWIIVGISGLIWFFNRPQYTERQENERAIYRTLLTDMRYWGKSLIVQDTTSTYFDPRPSEEFYKENPEAPRPTGSRYERFRETYSALEPETLEDAESVEQQLQPFPADIWLYFLARYDIVPSEQIDAGNHDVYLSFSNVGFNSDYTQAIVFVFYSCGGFLWRW